MSEKKFEPLARDRRKVLLSDSRGRLDAATGRLAEVLRRGWDRDMAARGLHSAPPLIVRWAAPDLPTAAHSGVDPDDGRSFERTVPISPRGTVDEIAAVFRMARSQQLVVLGETGSGKTITAMMLALGLLRDPKLTEPVPFPALMASWRPDVQRFDDWLANKLTQDFPFLASEYGRDSALELITTGRVMPVLDGLDEIPDVLRRTAIEAVDRAISGRPLVLTCRTSEYHGAALASGQVLPSAVVVELEPVGLDDAVTFLTATEPAAAHWGPVLAGLPADPDAPLARALASPLMVSLARTVYLAPETMPSELLDVSRFPDREAIERRLFDGLIPAVYGKKSGSGEGKQSSTCDPVLDQVRRWLTFLAGHLDRHRTFDLAWWQLTYALSSPQAGALAGILTTLTIGLTIAASLAIVSALLNGLAFGVTFGVFAGLAAGFSTRPAIDSPAGRPNRLPRRLRLRLSGPAAGLGLLVGFVGAMVFSATLYKSGVVFAVSIGLIVLLLAIMLFLFLFGIEQVELDREVSPAEVLRLDRNARLVIGLLTLLTIGIPFWFGISHALGIGGGLAVAIAYVSSGPYGRFSQARIWLFYQRRLPLRLMMFLADAHDRQVLRQVGSVYQFRHRRLQERLASQAGANHE
jgi:MFS family permease